MSRIKKNKPLDNFLRKNAEEVAGRTDATALGKSDESFPEEIRVVMHELKVHQIELEMQNQELRQTQEVLSAARERYFEFYDLAPVGYFSLSTNGLIIEANLTLATWLGVDRGALVMQSFTLYIRSEDQDVFYLYMKQLLKARVTQSCELWLLERGGAEFCAQLDATASKGADGVEVYRVVVTDVTKRKLTEETLRENELKYRHLFEMESDALFLIDAQSGKIIEANVAAVDLYGYSRTELLQMRNVDLSAEPGETRKAGVAAGSSGIIKIPLRYHRKKGGTIFPVEINATSLIWKGRPAHLPAIRDITERKKVEAALGESEQRFKKLFEEAPLGIAIIDSLTGHICEVNPMFAKIAGRTMDEMIQIDWMSITHPDDVQEDLDNMALLNAGKINGFQMQKRYLRNDGNSVWISMTLAQMKVEDKTLPRHLCMIEDITSHKEAEAKINQMERLTSLGGLAAGVVHEISQPLQALKVTADAMVYCHDQGKTADPEKVMEACRRVSVQAERIAAILKRLRSFINQSRSDNLEAVNLNEAQKQAVDLLRQRLKAHSIILREQLSADPPIVWGNSGRMEEVIINLVVNAMQALEDVKRTDKVIVITTSCQDEKVVLEVYNNGPGIPDEVMDKIFDPLYSTRENSENMGLGLSIVRSIVAAHDGRIEIVNHDDGVSFRIEFPRHHRNEDCV